MKAHRSFSGLAVRAAVAGSVLLALGCQGDNLPPGPPAPAAVASISLSFPSATLSMGAVQPLQPQFRDADGNVLIGITATWTTSNAAIASVDQSGNVTGVALGGPVTITVAKDGHSASATVSVVPDRVSISPFAATVIVNQTLQLTAAALDYSGMPIASVTGPVTWISGTPSVATIDATTGLLTAVAPGIVRIFATTAGRTGALDVEVGVPGVYDGNWSGASVNSAGFASPVQLTVIFGQVKRFQLTYTPPSCPSLGSAVAAATPNAPIINAQFSFTVSVPGASWTVSGSFAGPSTMTGTNTPLLLGSCPGSSGISQVGERR